MSPYEFMRKTHSLSTEDLPLFKDEKHRAWSEGFTDRLGLVKRTPG